MTQEERKSTLEDYLLGRVKKSGYPLEIEISNILENERFAVFNTQYYFDAEAHQGRDIDIFALTLGPEVIDDKLLPLSLRTDLAIECKKSETHAWVFYTRPRLPMSSIYMHGQFRTTVPKPEEFSMESFEWFLQHKCLILHYDKFAEIAIAYEEIKKKKMDTENGKKRKNGSSRKEIFEATNQLVKFTSYEMHQIYERIAKLPWKDKREVTTLFFPVIVFDGDMFVMFLDSGEPRLERRKHVLLGTHYRCPYCLNVESFTVDIVHRSHFNEFIQLWKTHLHTTKETMLRNHSELLKKANEDKAKFSQEEPKQP
jgi:hypothetical protein